MNPITSKFDKVLNASSEYGHVNHEPDSSKEQQRNTPQNQCPFLIRLEIIRETKGFLYNHMTIVRFTL